METVTAVMITGKSRDRIPLALAAIKSFNLQVYPSKNLLILNDGDYSLHEESPELFNAAISEIHIPHAPERTLGDLRNIGLEHVGKGNVLIQWDDDDWYHHKRIWEQMQLFTESGAEHPVTLAAQIRYSFSNDTAIMVYQPKQPNGDLRGIPGTILYRVPEFKYESARKHEDSWFFNKFSRVHVLNNFGTQRFGISLPELYIRFEHGSNTWNAAHIMGKYSDPRRKHNWYIPEESKNYLRNILDTHYLRS